MRSALFGAVFLAAVMASGQAQNQHQDQEQAPAQAAPPKGTVIFQKDDKTDALPEQQPKVAASSSSSSSIEVEKAEVEKAGPPDADVVVADEEREAITFTAYDLDLHLTPLKAAIEAHVNLTVRNDGNLPLTRLAIQLSSTLVWESLRLRSGAAASFVQHRTNTDADHTGVAREAVLTLSQALAPGASVELTGFYTGTIAASAERLERIGAPADQAAMADWDAIGTGAGGSATSTALRGYGDVLWYPVAGAPVFLGDGAKLFDAVGRTRQRQQAAMVRLRLTIAYTGEAPDAAYFCGRREPFTHTSENDGLPVAESPGIASAQFATQKLGFRVPSLFLTDKAVTMADGGLIEAVTDNPEALARYKEAAAKVQPLLMDWLGDDPLGPLDMIDHAGQPFEDGTLLVAPMRVVEPAALTPMMVHTLAHAWFRSSHAWLDEGVAQFLSLLWVETNDGRQQGVDRLEAATSALALAEPAAGSRGAGQSPGQNQGQNQGQSLVGASSEVYYRTKAAAVFWMLRGIVGDDALKKAFQACRKNKASDASADGFQKILEEASHKDLQWFFDDWVYHDKGLPDLSIAHVSPRPLPDKGGKSAGWLITIDVRNDGDAVAEVPVTVRSGELTATERLRIPGKSNAATRILFQGTPDEVVVNDGTVPEVAESIHIKKVAVKSE